MFRYLLLSIVCGLPVLAGALPAFQRRSHRLLLSRFASLAKPILSRILEVIVDTDRARAR